MNNYKIRINNEAESREAQELFFELGYQSGIASNKHFPVLIVAHDCGNGPESTTAIHMNNKRHKDYEELTLPQLRDLVVLHRNDVSDATHTDEEGAKIYLTSNKVVYYWQGEWCKSAINESNDYENYIANSLKTIQKPQLEQALISGADALRALADGKEVEYLYGTQWESATGNQILISAFIGDKFKFRLKPRTVKLEIEVPSPFEPKVGELFWHISPQYEKGFAQSMYDDGNIDTWQQFGAWRTAEEIKIVVEQLRKLKEHSK